MADFGTDDWRDCPDARFAYATLRDRLEHYGRWGQVGSYQLTQLYACRNLDTYPVVGWLMGGLNYHAVHHAFPDIPFNRLPAAFDLIQAVLQRHNLPLMLQGKGYLHETIELNRHPATIGTVNHQNDLMRG